MVATMHFGTGEFLTLQRGNNIAQELRSACALHTVELQLLVLALLLLLEIK